MAKKNQNPIAYRATSGATFIDMEGVLKASEVGKFTPTIPPNRQPSMPWSAWGKNNLFPQELIANIECTGILNSIIDGKARFALCEGMVPAIVKRNDQGQRVIDSYVDDPEITAFLEMNNVFSHTFGWMKDQIAFGNGVARYLLDKGKKKITNIMRHDVSEMRLEKMDETGVIHNAYFHADWTCVKGKADKTLLTVPLLDPNNPVGDLQNRKGQSNEFALLFKYPGWGKHYYSTPLWFAAMKWVKIAQGIPEMKAALYQNTMTLKYMVIINENFWEKRHGDDWQDYTDGEKEEKRNAFYDEVDEFLVGAENAHKSIFVNGYRDQVSGVQWQDVDIKPIGGETASGDYLPDAATANSEIAFALLFNPSIIGASMPSGPYTNSQGGSSVRESVLLQIILHELERRNIARVMNVVKYFNGWDKTHPGLEFIIPATVLTTLDTGGSSKPVTMGANAEQNQNPNPTK
jgi:hypothetical protein